MPGSPAVRGGTGGGVSGKRADAGGGGAWPAGRAAGAAGGRGGEVRGGVTGAGGGSVGRGGADGRGGGAVGGGGEWEARRASVLMRPPFRPCPGRPLALGRARHSTA
ncbi:hypothetical protein GCM10018772_46840 [Streptomyces fumanus]|uniref:Uncharacterized protein n=1 Tax=Streptomyces fumanus TaxID=67302 RepID=A0A919AMH3_9ACTN|nr:hypothetical protein GCM10018772_46840 [Streptomyces fumanus]